MPSIYDLKPRFQALLRPAVRALVERGVTPNHLTACRLLFTEQGRSCEWAMPRRRGSKARGVTL